MTLSEIERLQAYLRKLFSSEFISITPPPRRGLPTELVVKNETIGTVHKDVDEGETSYSIHLTVLEEDLAQPQRTPPRK